MPTSLICCGNRTPPFNVNAALFKTPKITKAIKKRHTKDLGHGFPVSGEIESGSTVGVGPAAIPAGLKNFQFFLNTVSPSNFYSSQKTFSMYPMMALSKSEKNC